MTPNFDELLNKVLRGTASEEEHRELELMLRSGEYDDKLTAEKLSRHAVLDPERAQKRAERSYPAIEKIIGASLSAMGRSRAWLAAAAIVVIAMVAGVWFIAKEKEWFNANLAEQNDLDWEIYSGKQVVTLPDGSKVVLNDNSELQHSKSFGETTREVKLNGEATFDVAHDRSHPFIVHTGKVTTKVLGTEFNVKAYSDQQEVTVTVLRGLVEVLNENRILGKIKPNEEIAINTGTDEFVQKQTNAQEAVQWRSNFLVLDNVSLEEAAKIVGDKFNVKIKFENEALKRCRYFGSFLNNENLTDVLTSISIAMRIEFEIEKTTSVVTFRGKGCE
ncbi:FecR domain-containing protein [Fulvivirgaceae bacterium PWU4]|uniref:FecR domain-containing protein n=1 Tax=Chryseosolibacter histidini TaxID=2782349 RepID=A0AAP2DR62_9BACT|nr:FecR family protein [Chryseosolibacter histidini]MBT1701040.1 FecR domain-containing protein [Chryseosolibacter histidini]